MIAMVLAAGLGTRLRPLTERIAKPALPLLGTTLLECNLALARSAGATEVVVNAHHLPRTVAAAARAAAERLSLRLHLAFETPDVLGTGGALVAARPLLDRGEPFLLLNGDVLTDIDPRPALEAHRRAGADTTMVLRPMPEGAPFAPVEVGGDGLIARIAGQGRELGPAEKLQSYAFTGIHVLSSAIFEALPKDGAPCVNRDGHARLIAQGRRVFAHVDPTGRWSDVGTPERYLEANLDLLEGRYRLPLFEAVGDARPAEQGAFVAPDASIEEGVELIGPCYVGSKARVRAGSIIGPRAALLAGSEASGRFHDAVLAPGSIANGGAGGLLA